MFQVIDGDAFNANIDVLCQGNNIYNTWGAGFALIAKKEYPKAYTVDCATIKGDKTKLGTYTFWTGPHSRIPNKTITLLNCYTQSSFKRNSVQADYEAINNVMKKISVDFKNKSIGFPFIGAGLAGGDPQTILNIFVDIFKNTPNTTTLYLRTNEFFDIERKQY